PACPPVVLTEPRPLRTKELLERMASRSVSASKIPKQGPIKTPIQAACITTSALVVPSIGFSYPKSPAFCGSKRRLEFPYPSKENVLKTPIRAACITTSALVVPSIGFSYPKSPAFCGSKRRLEFPCSSKENVLPKLQRITTHLRKQAQKGWQVNTENRLRRLSASDLVSLLRYLLPLAGVKPPQQLSRDGYVMPLMTALQQLAYPKQVSPSSLRAPDSQHIVEVLDFLMDFAEHREPGHCYAFANSNEQQFFEEAARNFSLDPAKREANRLQLVTAFCASPLDVMDMQKKLTGKELELEKLDFADKFPELEAEKLRLEEEVLGCKKELDTIAFETRNLEQQITEKGIRKNILRQQLAGLQLQVANQPYTRQVLEQLRDQQEDGSEELRLLRLRIHEFSERLDLAKMKLKRCRKELRETIEAFNVQIRDMEYSLVLKRDGGESLQLPFNPTPQDIRERCKRLQ
ncbi:hypothetical protein KR018_012477, partial [Drosophila ironensis]